MLASALEAEVEAEDLGVAGRECVEGALDLVVQEAVHGLLLGVGQLVGHEALDEGAVAFGVHGGVEADVAGVEGGERLDDIDGQAGQLRQLLGVGLAAKLLAQDLGRRNIRVNAILPGIVEGPRMSAVIAARAKQTGVSYEAMEKTYLERVSMRRMVTASDVAATIAYLLSPAGRNISGQSIGVDGNVETL